jgi:hypothetical protein
MLFPPGETPRLYGRQDARRYGISALPKPPPLRVERIRFQM